MSGITRSISVGRQNDDGLGRREKKGLDFLIAKKMEINLNKLSF